MTNLQRTPAAIAALLITAVGLMAAQSTAMGVREVRNEPSTATRTPTPVAQFPFRLVSDHIVVSVGINGSPEIDMLLDTGMPLKGVILLDPDVSKDLGLDYSGRLQLGGGGTDKPRTADVAYGSTLRISDATFPNQQIMALREGDFADDWPVAAVIGQTIFDHVVEIDFAGSTISLFECIGDVPDPGERLELDFTMGIPMISGRVLINDEDRLSVSLMADTGVNDPLILFPHSDERIRLPEGAIRGTDGVLSEGLSGDMLGSLGRTPALDLGPFTLTDVVTGYPDEATMGHAALLGQNGFIGIGIMKRFTVTFDFGEKSLYLSPNDSYGEPFEWNMAGLLMWRNRDGLLQVKEIMLHSPGAEGGVRAGDIITEIDGRDVRKLSNAEVLGAFTRDGMDIDLGISRNSEQTSVSLKLRRLF